jgi:N-acetylmuramic acid 6-phosphate etherase
VSEEPHARADELDRMSTAELLELMNTEDRHAVDAVHEQVESVARAVDLIAERLREGGRLHYFGAGTSGRLAALDAAECAPTFGVAADQVVAHVAGDGDAEDDAGRGADDARSAGLSAADAVVAVSASGSTPYVLAAVDVARKSGALIVAVTCAAGSALAHAAGVAVEVPVGAEVIAGSSRLKAGTAQKVVLNMISTAVFTRLGRTYRGRMIGVAAANQKQRLRAVRLVVDLSGASQAEAERALDEFGWDARAALAALGERALR